MFRTKNALIFGVLLGGLAGFLYQHYIGCGSGSCLISSNPWVATAYGATFGGLMLSINKKKNNKYEDNN